MKKILSSIFVFAFLFSPLTALAGGGPIYLVTSDMTQGLVGQYYSEYLVFNNDNGTPVNITITNLPPGLSIQGSGYNTAALSGKLGHNYVTIAGVPTTSGSYALYVDIVEQNGSNNTQAFVYMTVNASQAPACHINWFTASQHISQGQPSILAWNTSNCNAVKLVSTNAAGNVLSVPLSTSVSGSYNTGPLSAPAAYYRLAASSGSSVDVIAPETQSNVFIPVDSASPGCHISYSNITLPGGGTQTIPTQSVVRGTAASISWATTGCIKVWVVATNNDYTQLSEPYSMALSGSVSTGPLVDEADQKYAIYATAKNNIDKTNITQAEAFIGFPISVTPSGESGGAFHSNPPRNVLHNGTVYEVSSGLRQAYTSAGAFLSYSFNTWSGVVPATPKDLEDPIANGQPLIPPRNGSLINDHGTVYLISNGQRAGFTTEAVFKGFGFSYSNVAAGDTSFLPTLPPISNANTRHPWGTLVNQDGTVYFISDDDKWGLTNMDALYSWGLKPEEIVPANSFDRQLQQTNVLNVRGRYSFSL